jgi:wobble nucleotide-excising tRNase
LIKDCGIFEDFRWDTAVPDFERINLIYGANGVGKSSLSRALDGLDFDSDGYRRVSIRMGDADKTNNRTSNQRHDRELDRVLVFSEGYVSRSHNFKGDTEIDAVITLGERTVEEEKQIAELHDLIESAEKQLKKAADTVVETARNLESEYTTVARGMVTALSRAGGRYRSNSNYNSGFAKRQFDGSRESWALLSESQLTADLATVNSDNRDKVPVKSYSLLVQSDLCSAAAALLAASPVSIVLDTLRQNPATASWVEQGRHHHEGLSQCVFCGGPLTEDRRKQIEQHFSHEVGRVQQELDRLIHRIASLQTALQGLLGDGTLAGSLFDDLRDAFRSAHAAAKDQESHLQAWVTGLLGALRTKRANVVARVDYVIAEPPSVDGTQIEEALKAHNERVSQHDVLAQQAAARVEHHLLKECEDKIAGLAEKVAEARSQQADIEKTLRGYREEAAALENVEGDPLPSAEVISRELTRILGRNELGFELLADGKHYRVTRHGKPACDLSTGERTAITLIHFLEHVKRVGSKNGKPIVVIDDPVSSLDSGSAMGISTYIWSETVSKDHIEQVFLLTHNFDLFRQWDIQIEKLPGKRGATNRSHPSSCYELVAPHKGVDGAPKRVPAFIPWPPSFDMRSKMRSSYHHAFITAVRAHEALTVDDSIEKKLDAMLLYPNMLRRMLETFLAFKSPASVGDFTSAMRKSGETLKASGYQGDTDALRLQLTRFMHGSSHAESPETDVAVNPDEIQAIIAAVFTFMNAIDKPHFEGLCEIVGVAPSDLLLQPQAPITLAQRPMAIQLQRTASRSARERLVGCGQRGLRPLVQPAGDHRRKPAAEASEPPTELIRLPLVRAPVCQ